MPNEKHKRRKYASSLRFIACYLPQKYKGKLNTRARNRACLPLAARSGKNKEFFSFTT
jgi:hypothetical protein